MGLADEVRRNAAQIARDARWVSIDLDRAGEVQPGPAPSLDPDCHYLEGAPDEVALYLLTLGSINFGSGWFGQLRKREVAGRRVSGYFTVAWALSDRFRGGAPWTAGELRALSTREVALTLGQPADLELMALYAQSLRLLGRFLGARSALQVVAGAGDSAQRLARTLADEIVMFNDVGFFKRALITANDLALAGVANFTDLDDLPIFADNLVPHVLRCDGVLVYADWLAAHIDAKLGLPAGEAEREIRACAVHACELIARRTGVAPRALDGWLWNRGQEARYKTHPRHRTRTVFY